MTNEKTEATIVQVLAGIEASGRWTSLTLELLGDASVLAQRWGGVVGAWCLTGPEETKADPAELASHGCDTVCLLKHERLARWSSEVIAAALVQRLSAACRVVLLPGDSRGEEVAALLAEGWETTWIPDALTLSVTRGDLLEITAMQPGGKLARIFRPTGERPTVVTMRHGVPEARRATPPRALTVEEWVLDLSAVPALTTVERFLPADPGTVDIAFADRVVAGGRGTGGPVGMGLVAELAGALGAAVGASRLAVDLGWAPQERQVGQTGRTVRPDLYVACGISGASHHLAGMRESKHIVAINPDSSAPLHDIAHLSLYSDLHRIVPTLVAALRRRAKPA